MSRSTLSFLVALLALALLLATAAGAPAGPAAVGAARPAGIAGAGQTEAFVANLDASQPATIVGDFYNQRGGPPTAILLPMLAPEQVATLDLGDRPELPNGAYAAIFSSDRAIGTLVTARWPSSGGAASYGQVRASADVVVPLVVKGAEGHTSLITVQNTDPNAQANVEIRVYRSGETTPTKTVLYSVSQGTSFTTDLMNDPNFVDVPSEFVGHARVSSASPVAVQSFVDIETSAKGVYAFDGVPADLAADRLLAPVVHAAWAGPDGHARTTRIALVNPGATALEASIRYLGRSGPCADQSFTEGPISLAGGAGVVVSQAPSGSGPGAGPLPAGCEAAAVVEATGGGLVGVAVDIAGSGSHAAAYNLQSDTEAALRTVVASFRRRAEGTTAIYAQNAGDAAATATVALFDERGRPIGGCGASCTATISPGAAARWYVSDLPGIPDGTVGHALVTSDQPLVVVTIDEADSGLWDLLASAGIPADGGGRGGPLQATATPAPPAIPSASYAPILMRIGDRPRTPTPIDAPTDTPEPRPTPTVAVGGPLLTLPDAIPAGVRGAVRIPVTLDTAGEQLGGVAFALRIDPRWVAFDPTDRDGDGVPDDVAFHVPTGYDVSAVVGAADNLEIRVAADSPSSAPLDDGTLVEVALEIGTRPGDGAAAVRFGDEVSFTDIGGDVIAGGATGETHVPIARTTTIYMPYGHTGRPEPRG